jgi:predicted MFS family arabinose efflux permease
MSAVALNSFIWQASRMAMPALGGLLIAATDTWVVFALGAAGFVVMFSVVTTLPPQPSEPATGSPLQQVREGLTFIWHQPLFRWLMGLTFVGMFFGQSFNQLMPVFSEMMGSGETGYGYLLSAGGIGSVLGTLLIGGVHQYRRLGRLMLAAAAIAASLTMLFAGAALTGIFGLALIIALAAAIFASAFNISSMTVLQLSVPDRLRGRVMGIHSMGFSLMPLGALLLGALAERLGASAAVWITCAIYLAAIGFVHARQPIIRDLDGQALGELR